MHSTSHENRLLVVGRSNGHDPAMELQQRLPTWRVDSQASFLAGIADLARRPATAVLARIVTSPRLGQAIAGLREASGRETRIILSCPPQHEPAARAALSNGADDYVLEPLVSAEVEAAIGLTSPSASLRHEGRSGSAAVLSMEDLAAFGELLSDYHRPPRELAERVAALIGKCMGARATSLIVEGAVCTSGNPPAKPVLTAALSDGRRVLGQVMLGEPVSGPYNFADAQKLEHLASICARLLSTASQCRQFEQLAHTDDCTGLHNRRFLRNRLAAILERAAMERFQVTVLLFDIDDFKSCNDRFGHDAGDEILRVAGQLFRRNCREQDVVARYGGDEFCVVFWDPAGPREAGSRHLDEALVVLDRFQGALRAHRFAALHTAAEPPASDESSASTAAITVSGGLATFPWDGETVAALLARADAALLSAKRAGKNRIVVVGDSAKRPAGT